MTPTERSDRLKGWNSVRTIPTDRPVWVLTATGIVCLAVTYPRGDDTRWLKRPTRCNPFLSISCYRLRPGGGYIGDVKAIGWRAKGMIDAKGVGQ